MVALQARALRAPVFLRSITSKIMLYPLQATFKMHILLVLYALTCIFFGLLPRCKIVKIRLVWGFVLSQSTAGQ
jgi:hypothetical protein